MRFLLLLSFIILTACSSSKPEESLSPASQTEPPASPSKPKTVSLEEVLRQNIAEPFLQQQDGNLLTIRIANTEPETQEGIKSLCLKLAEVFYKGGLSVKVVALEMKGDEGAQLKAHFYMNDAADFFNNKISEPEFLRRLSLDVAETVDSLKKKGLEARGSGNLAEAEAIFKKWVEAEPNSIVALSFLGNVLRDQKKYTEALDVYKKILEIDAKSLFALHNTAFCYEKMGAFDEAVTPYRQALEMDSKNPILMQQLAQVYSKNGDFNGAMAWLGRAREIKDTADLWLIQGNVLRDFKKYTEAREAYLKAQKLNPADARIVFNLILLDLDTKQYAAARKKYESFATVDPVLAQELTRIFELPAKEEVESDE
ncbi:tetratricopeptide repeat protein [bacterium]|nr:tetratricopeptide repeat protein [bacterium]